MGVDTLKKFAYALGQVVALVYGFLVEKSGILGLLWGIKEPLSALQGFFNEAMLAKAKAEIMDLSDEEYRDVVASLMSPMQPALQAKLQPVEDLVEKVIDLAIKSVSFGKDAYAQVVAIIAEFKAIFA